MSPAGGLRRATLALLLVLGLGLGAAFAQTAKLQGFATPEAAATAFADALRRDDDKAFGALLGAGWRDLVAGSEAQEDETRSRFLEAWDARHEVTVDGDRATVGVGTTGWTLPLPLVREGGEWRFDVAAGRQEIVAREIGRNELSVIQSLLALVDAQRDYAALDPMKTGLPVYARRLLSSPGRKDGLYWETAPGEPESPIGAALAKAQAEGQGGPDGYHGYRFRLLYGQGPAAAGGARDYLVDGRMLGGFGVIAWPVRYGETGVMTFVVNQDGQVYEKDLGPETTQRAAAIARFDPDSTWEKSDLTPP